MRNKDVYPYRSLFLGAYGRDFKVTCFSRDSQWIIRPEVKIKSFLI